MGVEDDHKRFSEFAAEIGLEGDDAENFVNSSMKRKGYKPRMAWDEPEPQQEQQDDGDFFSNRRQKKEQQQQQQQQKQSGEQKIFGYS